MSQLQPGPGDLEGVANGGSGGGGGEGGVGVVESEDMIIGGSGGGGGGGSISPRRNSTLYTPLVELIEDPFLSLTAAPLSPQNRCGSVRG